MFFGPRVEQGAAAGRLWPAAELSVIYQKNLNVRFWPQAAIWHKFECLMELSNRLTASPAARALRPWRLWPAGFMQRSSRSLQHSLPPPVAIVLYLKNVNRIPMTYAR